MQMWRHCGPTLWETRVTPSAQTLDFTVLTCHNLFPKHVSVSRDLQDFFQTTWSESKSLFFFGDTQGSSITLCGRDSPKCARKQRQTLCQRHILSPLVHEHGVQLKTQPSDNRPVSRNTLECGYVNKSNSMVQLKVVIKVEPIKNIAWRVLPAPKTIGNVTVMNNLISHTLCPTSTEHSATYS